MSTESIFTDVTIKSETDAERLVEAIEKSIIEEGKELRGGEMSNYIKSAYTFKEIIELQKLPLEEKIKISEEIKNEKDFNSYYFTNYTSLDECL